MGQTGNGNKFITGNTFSWRWCGNALNVSLEAHRELLQYLKKNEKNIWIAPMIEVAEYIKKYQASR